MHVIIYDDKVCSVQDTLSPWLSCTLPRIAMGCGTSVPTNTNFWGYGTTVILDTTTGDVVEPMQVFIARMTFERAPSGHSHSKTDRSIYVYMKPARGPQTVFLSSLGARIHTDTHT